MAVTALAAVFALALAAPALGADDILRPSKGAWFGAFVKKRNGLDHYRSIRRLERKIDRRLGIDHHYLRWGGTYLGYAKKDLRVGRIPMISWPGGAYPKGVNAKSIRNGDNDATIRKTADAIKALGEPVFLRFAFEMDQNPGGAHYIGEPADFRPAWRRVHRIFQQRGATNAVWVFCGAASRYSKGRTQKFYPGDAYVDWIAADGFSFYPVKLLPTAEWRSLGRIFAGFYDWGRTKGKPLMIAATGVQEDPNRPLRKARWFKKSLRTLKNWPKIKAFVYWHATHPTPNGKAKFWADTSAASLAAFRALGRRPYMNPPPP